MSDRMTPPLMPEVFAADAPIYAAAQAVAANHLEDELSRVWVGEILELIETTLDPTDPDVVEAVRKQAHAYLAELRALLLFPQRWIPGVWGGAK